MFIRRSFDEFLKLHSDVAPAPGTRDWVIDWRWFCEETSFPSERSLIDWPAWAKPRTPKRG